MSDEENYENQQDPNAEEEEAQEEAIKEPQNPLKLEIIKNSLKKLSKTYSGLSYVYTELDIKEKELDDMCDDLSKYTHLRDINMSTNKFPHINPVASMTYLVRLDASKNEVKEINIFTEEGRFEFLQILLLNENKVKELPNLRLPSLLKLNLEANLIETCINFQGLDSLVSLNLNNNKLKSLDGLTNMPNLDVLYVNDNSITSLKGLDKLDKVRKLRIKNNKIEKIDFLPNLPNLQKLNISSNLIKDLKEFSALKFRNLKKIIVEGNPCFDEANAGAKVEILLQLEELDIKFVNKEEILQEDKEQAKTVKEERIAKEREEAEEREKQRLQEEQERLEKEEEERKIREQEEEERRLKEQEEAEERERQRQQEEQERLEKEEEERKQREDTDKDEARELEETEGQEQVQVS